MIAMTSPFILSPCPPLYSVAWKHWDSKGPKKCLNGGLSSLSLPLLYHKKKDQIGPDAKLCESVSKLVQANGCILANAVIVGALGLSISVCGLGRADAKEAMNRPELLPKEFTPLIDVAGFLSTSQESRIIQEITNLENDTGFKLRVVAQNYPNTPGIAVKDFWQVDDNTIVFVADPTFGNILNFNVGPSVDLDIPRSFWSRLAGKYGNIFYWREKGEDASIEAAVSAISSCLREPRGPNICSEIK